MLCSANGTAMVSVVCLSVTFVHLLRRLNFSAIFYSFCQATCMSIRASLWQTITASTVITLRQSVLHLTISAGETLVSIVAGTHPWLVCKIIGAIV